MNSRKIEGSATWEKEHEGPIRAGSEDHKQLFCRMLLDTHNPFDAAAIVWPVLGESEKKRLTALPIWDIAVRTEGTAKLRMLSYAKTIADPLVSRALRLNGDEEGRHKMLLAQMVAAYGIVLSDEPAYVSPRDAEWAYMMTGYSECIDSFFAFGLFEIARRSGFFPSTLVQIFEPVMQEECRHILFFVNWVAWHRRNMPWWRQPLFGVRILAVWACLVWERVATARDVGGGDNFTATGHESLGLSIDFAGLMKTCLDENDRRMNPYDGRLQRPKVMPHTIRLVLRCIGVRRLLVRKGI